MKKSKKIIITIILAIVICVSFTGCASLSRELKSVKSDFSGGLERTVIVYTLTGEELGRYEGKIDLEITDGGKVLFDLDGKRHIFYNCTIEVIEK